MVTRARVFRLLRIATSAVWAHSTVLIHAAEAATYRATLLDLAGTVTGASGTSQVGVGIRPGPHALLWYGTEASVVDLHPPGSSHSYAYGVSGASQVGSSTFHAMLWSGTAESAVDLHPVGFYASSAKGVSGATQVGSATPTRFDQPHAHMWNGTAASAVDLHPAGFFDSYALGVSGASQVGWGQLPNGLRRALLWHGTAESVVDLTPPAFETCYAMGVSGDTQFGRCGLPGPFGGPANDHAFMWNGTAQSAMDLNPSGFGYSEIVAMSGTSQVGRGIPFGFDYSHALLWKGTSSSAVDLHFFLSGLVPTFTYSYAMGITENGTIVGNAVWVDELGAHHSYAVMWTPIPEPASCGLFSCGLIVAASIRRRC